MNLRSALVILGWAACLSVAVRVRAAEPQGAARAAAPAAPAGGSENHQPAPTPAAPHANAVAPAANATAPRASVTPVSPNPSAGRTANAPGTTENRSRNEVNGRNRHQDNPGGQSSNQPGYYGGGFVNPNWWQYSYPWSSTYPTWDPGWYNGANYSNASNSNDEPPSVNSTAEPVPTAAMVAPTAEQSPSGAVPLAAVGTLREAEARVTVAQAEYDAATSRVLATLRATPAYQAALARKQQDGELVQATKVKEAVPTTQQVNAAATKLEAAKSVTDLEQAALATDPQASAAKMRLTAAIAQRDAMRPIPDSALPRR